MTDHDPLPSIIIESDAPPELRVLLGTFDAAIYESPDTYAAAAAALLDGQMPADEAQSTAAKNISQVLESSGGGRLIVFDDATEEAVDHFDDDRHRRVRDELSKAMRRSNVSPALRSQVALDRIRIYAGTIVSGYLIGS